VVANENIVDGDFAGQPTIDRLDCLESLGAPCDVGLVRNNNEPETCVAKVSACVLHTRQYDHISCTLRRPGYPVAPVFHSIEYAIAIEENRGTFR
jgi:hypothetical protein